MKIIPTWDWVTLSAFSKSKIVKSMVYWLFVTPILAKALSSINHIDLKYLGFDGNINLTLPFSWTAFFFSALFFSFGNLLYSIKCPELIKDYKDFNNYASSQKSIHYLVESFKRDTERFKDFKPNSDFYEIVIRYSPIAGLTNHNVEEHKWTKLADSLKEANEKPLSDLYSGFKLVLKEYYPCWRKASTIIYLLGVAAFLLVVTENIFYVATNII
jgi:hypothetical protein